MPVYFETKCSRLRTEKFDLVYRLYIHSKLCLCILYNKQIEVSNVQEKYKINKNTQVLFLAKRLYTGKSRIVLKYLV